MATDSVTGIQLPGSLDAALVIETYETKVMREYLPNDIFDALSDHFINPQGDMEASALPAAAYLKLSAEADKGRTCKVPLIKDLSGAPTLGSTGDQRGNEEDIETKYFRMEYTDVSHATTNQAYGVLARDKAPYNIYEYRVEGLGRWYKQYFGKMRRQAGHELQSENLETGPHYLTAGISPNWFIPNRTFAQQPSYVTDPEDWVDAVMAAITAAGTGVNAAASIVAIQNLEEWARTEAFITPLEFEDGTDGYYLTMPTPQITWLNHVVQAGNYGNVYRDVMDIGVKDVAQKYPGLKAQVGGIRIVDDIRYATLTIGGSASNSASYLSDLEEDYTATIQYRGMGNADDGSSDPRDKTATARMLSLLIGGNAFCEWMPEGFHWEWEYTQYDKYFGSGIFCSVGIKQVSHDKTSNDATTLQQRGCISIPWAMPPRTNYYTSQTS